MKFDFVSKMAFATDRQELLVLVPEFFFLFFFFFFCFFAEGAKPHGGCRDFVTKK